jgi:ferredoxin
MIIKKSTLKVFKEHGPKNLKKFIHMYVYAKWTDKYLGIARRLLPKASKKDPAKIAATYHSKLLTTELAKKIVTVNKEIPLKDLEQVIPYPVARKIVLTNPLDIVALDCPCRASAPNPCSPSMVCMVIGKPFTDFILEHRPDKSKRITQEEALEILDTAHSKGWVHSAYFKEACLDRFYVICNCCQCCCLGMEAMVKHGVPIMAPSGYSAQIDNALCAGCGLCIRKCPFKAINSAFEVITDKCMGCGVCVTACPQKAISLHRDDSRGIPLDVEAI